MIACYLKPPNNFSASSRENGPYGFHTWTRFAILSLSLLLVLLCRKKTQTLLRARLSTLAFAT